MDTAMQTFDCEAYGPDLPDHCFMAPAYSRCGTAAECHTLMDTERRMLYARLRILEQLGDELAGIVLEGIIGPNDLLGGPGY
jgi:hypothetical protein